MAALFHAFADATFADDAPAATMFSKIFFRFVTPRNGMFSCHAAFDAYAAAAAACRC